MTIRSIAFSIKKLLVISLPVLSIHKDCIVSLTNILRAAATLLVLAVALHFFMFGQFLIKTIVVAHILFILSIFSAHHAQRISIVSLGLAIVVPIGAWRMYESGDSTLGFFIFNLVIFIYVAYVSYKTLSRKLL